MANATLRSSFVAQLAAAVGVPAESVGASLASVAVVAPTPLAETPQAREAASAASVVVIAAGAAAAALALAAGAVLFYRAQQHALLQRQQAAALSLRRKLAASKGPSKGQGHIEMSNPLLANNSHLKGRGRAMHALVPQTSAVRAASIRAQRTSTAAAGKGRSVVSALGLPPPAPRPVRASTAPENEGERATDGSVASGAVKAPRVSLAPVALLHHHGARERPAAAQLSKKAAAEEWLRIVEDDGDVYWEHKASGEQTREEPPSLKRAREAKAAADAAARRR